MTYEPDKPAAPSPTGGEFDDLRDRLGAAHARSRPHPHEDLSALDAAVMEHARARLIRSGKLRVGWRAVAGVAIAASLGVAVWITVPSMGLPAQPAAAVQHASGVPLDVVDVYAVALAVRDGRGVNTAWDRTHDGLVGERDIAALLAEVVRLEEM